LYDGDIVCLTNQKEVIDGAYGGLPVMYETKKADKCKIIESELYKFDMNGFNTKVGFLTNLSTTMYAMLPMFDENSKEYKEIIRRLKQCRREQGAIIDATKGLVIRPIPSHWTNWTKITDSMTEEEKETANFNNSILISKRPMFMTNLYSSYSKEYRKYYSNYDTLSQARFCIFLEDLLDMGENSLNDKQKEFISQFYRFTPLLDTDCVTNNISKYMQKKVKEIKQNSKHKNIESNIKILKSPDFEIDKVKLDKLYTIYKKYKSGKRNFDSIKEDNGENRYKTLEQYCKSIRQEALLISSNICELASLAVTICYELHTSDNKSFAWMVFGDGLIENIISNRQDKLKVPFLDKGGDITYLGEKYIKKQIVMGEDIAYDLL